MMEQQWKEMEFCMEQQQKELTLRMEPQHCELAAFIERSVSAVISQVPHLVQNVFSGMGGILNIAPLQLQAPSSSQPPLMLTENMPIPQGSGTSTRGESTMVGPVTSILPVPSSPDLHKCAHIPRGRNKRREHCFPRCCYGYS